MLASIWPHGAPGLSCALAEPLLGDAKSLSATRNARVSAGSSDSKGAANCDHPTRIEVDLCQKTRVPPPSMTKTAPESVIDPKWPRVRGQLPP